MSMSRIVSRRRFLTRAAATTVALATTSTLVGPHASVAPVVAQGLDAPVAVSALPSQTMQGFGASGAWWPNDLVHFRTEVRQAVADLLFGPRGIALSAYRYNIGGGGLDVTIPARGPETLLVSPGVYHWSRDPGGRLFLRLAAERGVPILIGFANSAPPVWTTSERPFGGYLREGAEAEYARYLVDIVTRFHDADDITLSYVSPMNEPNNTFEHGGQEGMGVPLEQRPVLIRALGRELAARAPYCRIIADESSRAGEQFMREVPQWLGDDETARYVAALAQHRYDFAHEVTLRLSRELAEVAGKPLWFTEICCLDSRTGVWGPQYDPTITAALQMANMIAQGLTVANDAAFHWWVACSSVIGRDPAADPAAVLQPNDDGWNDGLLYYDPNYAENGNQQIYLTKRYFALGHFSRYVRPGDRRHDVLGAPRDLQILAFANGSPAAPSVAPVQLPGADTSAHRAWTVVVINNARTGSDPTTFRLKLPLVGSERLTPRIAVETSADRDLDPVELPEVSPNGILSARVPAQSITTYVIGRPDGR
jgi:O-glycosyl hydrolase